MKYKVGDVIRTRPSFSLSLTPTTAEVIKPFPDADPEAYPNGLYLCTLSTEVGVYFVDDLGYLYGDSHIKGHEYLVKKP